MTDFQIRSDSVDVEQIMQQIRSRIREKRGADYTEDEIRALANAKLEKFLDPSGVRSDLLEHFRRARRTAQETGEPPMSFVFEDTTLFESPRPLLRWIRNMLKPVLRLFLNYNRLSQFLHQQGTVYSRFQAREERRRTLDDLNYEVMHNLVLETTRLGIEVKNLRMRLESISSRLDFDERRARALEGVVQYRPSVLAATSAAPASASGASSTQPSSQSGPRPSGQPAAPADTAGIAERRARRRRRRGRRRHGSGASGAPGASGAGALGADASDADADVPETLEAREPNAPAPEAPDAPGAPDAPNAPDSSDPERLKE
ncbi:MAG TPA: hypothetical protein VHJ77_20530 [Vicinamibacterales bacterium]|jgi:hypothetical protein|nr:hypothetical protein [Vicinamibacterales bacterium]